jgi:hypothetical protein
MANIYGQFNLYSNDCEDIMCVKPSEETKNFVLAISSNNNQEIPALKSNLMNIRSKKIVLRRKFYASNMIEKY